MAKKYVSAVELDIDGQIIDDFKKFEEGDLDVGKQIKLMNSTGYSKSTKRHTFSLDYVVPAGGEFNFEAVNDGTVTITQEDGGRITFTGAEVLKIGKVTYDGENEAARTIEFMAAKRVEE